MPLMVTISLGNGLTGHKDATVTAQVGYFNRY